MLNYKKFHCVILDYGAMLLYMKVISCTEFHKTSECFNLPVVVSGIQHTFPPRPSYNYKLADIPARVQFNLTCPHEKDSIHVQYAKYLFPAFSKDYCIDKNKECSESKPCTCCTKPARRICEQRLEGYEDFCIDSNGTCTMDVPQVTFTNHAGCIPYQCVDDTDKNWCVSRWIDVHYTCTSENGTIRLPIKSNTNSLVMALIRQRPQPGSTTTTKQLPTYFVQQFTDSTKRTGRGTNMTNVKIVVPVFCGVLLLGVIIAVLLHVMKKNINTKEVSTKGTGSVASMEQRNPIFDSALEHSSYEENVLMNCDTVLLPMKKSLNSNTIKY